MTSNGGRCPVVQMEEDGSIICTISGACVRTRSYGIEYEILCRQGFSASEVHADQHRNGVRVGGGLYASEDGIPSYCLSYEYSRSSHPQESDAFGSDDFGSVHQGSRALVERKTGKSRQKMDRLNEVGEEESFSSSAAGRGRKRKKISSKSWGECSRADNAGKRITGNGAGAGFVIRMDVMKGEFAPDSIHRRIVQFLRIAGQDTAVLQARYMYVCLLLTRFRF